MKPEPTDDFYERIAERLKAEQQLAEAERERLKGLRLFAQSIQRAQEEERSRMARE